MTAAALPPLVEPGPALDRQALERYSRHLLLPDIGTEGQRRLTKARVAVVGAGGLGAPVLTYLAAAGVGTLGVVDFDVVELSNLQRQTIHGVSDLDRPKTESAAAALGEINPLARVSEHRLRLDSDNALQVLRDYDLVIDGTDTFATRYLVNDACELLGLPYVWGSVFRFEGQMSVFWAKHGPTYRDVYPDPPPAGSVPSCGEGGVLGVVCGVVGSVLATEAVKLICGVGRPLLGRLLVYDALTMSFRTVTIRPDPSREPVRALVDYDAFCGVPPQPDGSQSDVSEVSAAQLEALLREGTPVTLIDVREVGEYTLGRLPSAELTPLGEILSGNAVDGLRTAAQRGPVVLYCKSGVRSARAIAELEASGVSGVRHLRGGILAWADEIDPSLPRY